MYDQHRTTALLLAGRTIDSFATVGQARELRRLAAPRGLTVAVAGDETYRGAPSEPEDDLHVRLAIGVPIATVTVNEAPFGPVDSASVADALDKVAAVGELWWRQVGRELGPYARFSPASRRASLPQRLKSAFRGVAFDGPDLVRTEDHVHLVAAGPLSTALLARGTVGALPLDEDGDLDLPALDGWVHGHRASEGHLAQGVEGEEIAAASILDLGTQAVETEVFDRGSVYLMARYD